MIGSGYERRDSAAEGAGAGGQRLRVYELAKELNVPHKDLVAKIKTLGIEVTNHMSHLEPTDVDRVRRALDRERHETLVEQRVSDTVIRRRSRTAAPAPWLRLPPLPRPPGRQPPRHRRLPPAAWSAPSLLPRSLPPPLVRPPAGLRSNRTAAHRPPPPASPRWSSRRRRPARRPAPEVSARPAVPPPAAARPAG